MRLLIGAAILMYAGPAAAGSGIFAPMGEMLLSVARSAANELGLPVCILGVIAALISAICGLGSPAKATLVAFIGFFVAYAEDILTEIWKHF